jgi:lipooligosaccharide transport system permease protein
MALSRTAFPSWERVARQRVYWATNYKRTWKGSAVTSFVSPLFYVVAMGVLLGGFVDDSTAGTDALGGAPSYLAFVAPGLAAAHAMQIATGEVTWPVMGNLKWHRTYYAMLATPLSVPDVVAAHLSYVAFRLGITTGVFLLVLAPFGVFESLVGVLLAWPVLVLVGMSFAGFLFAYSATIKDESGFSLVYRLMVIPLFLFSGAFFPIENLGPALEAVARFTPLWHGVDLTRMLVLDQVRPGAAVLHLVVLAVLSVVGALLATWRLTRRVAQ